MLHANDDTLPPPGLEALVAGTIALMTCWADPCADARLDIAAQRSLLARKVVSNLFFLQNHPQASEALRQVMANAQHRWVGLVQDKAAPANAQAAGAALTLH